ncbi:Lactoylglutathione lyase [Auxenochlorella protothecoides]|uniref:Lactoylglutathione lyase n=1 Tax=Auxenochlorella protothecoides TaxID=3075 RepID=A0A087SKI0_AUXPR|nr:Lactoylglutathione lyase [Auxenochlorella protothecoides]KFM26234.1 Lactoylglutathione lyase [Auxenochlorella protothecoides]
MAATASADWAQEDKRRLLHAVYRVGDLNKTIEVYQKAFGLKLLRSRDVPDEKYSNAFLGYGPEEDHFAFELTYNYGKDSYDIGEGFGHFAIATNDVYKLSKDIKKAGGNITREPGPVKGGDLDRSIDFYTRVLGLKLIRKRDNPEYKYTLAFLGYKGDESAETVFELTYNWGRDSYTKGDAYAQVAISTEDVYKTGDQIKAAGVSLLKEPGPLPGLGTKILSLTDPDGYKIVFVDTADFLKELEK